MWPVLGAFLLVLALVGMPAPAAAQGQDILIFRPVDNNATEVYTRRYEFEVEISAFTPVLEVKINGKPQPIQPGTTMRIKKGFRLKMGKNRFTVEASTAFETVSKKFVVRRAAKRGKAARDEEKDAFQWITVLGAQTSDNVLKVGDSEQKTEGQRSFLVMIPRWDWIINPKSSLRFQGVISRDSFDKEELAAEEIQFTQLTISWIQETSKVNSWSAGVGFNQIFQGFDGLGLGETEKESDVLLFGSMRRGLGKTSFYDVSLEIKTLDITAEAANPDLEEDATALTVKGALDGGVWVFKSKLQGGYTQNDAEGKLKDKTIAKLSLDLSIPFGTFIFALSARGTQTTFAEPLSAAEPAVEETLVTTVFNITWAVASFFVITAEAASDSQTANTASSEFENSSTTVSFILIF